MVDLRYGEDDGDLDNDNVVSGGLSGVKDRGDRGGEEGEREEKKLTRHPNCKLIPHNPLLLLPLLILRQKKKALMLIIIIIFLPFISFPTQSILHLHLQFFLFPPRRSPGVATAAAAAANAKYLILSGATKVLDTSTILLTTRALVIKTSENPELSKKVMNVAA